MRICIISLLMYASSILIAQDYFSLLVPQPDGIEQKLNPFAMDVNSEGEVLYFSLVNAGSIITKFSQNGKILNSTTLGDISLSKRAFMNIAKRNLFFGTDKSLPAFNTKATLIELNDDLDYINKVDYYYSDADVIPSESLLFDDFLFLVNRNRDEIESTKYIKIQKVDYDGNIITQLDLNREYKVSNPDKLIRSGENFILSSDLHKDLRIKSQVLKFDENLNELWEYESEEGNIIGLGPHLITELSNGNIVLTKTVDRSNDWDFINNHWYEEPTKFTWLDSGGNKLRDTIHTTDYDNDQFIWHVCKGNGDYFFTCGSWVDPVTDGEMGWIVKYDNDGHKIWDKRYRHTGYDSDERSHLIKQIIELEDGSILALGNILIPGESGAWLMKLDSDGCFGNQECGENVVLSIEDNFMNDQRCNTYPNPSFSGQLVALDAGGGDQIKSVSIYNINGQLIIEDAKFNNNEIMLNLRSGAYLIKVFTKNEVFNVNHIIIE